MVYKLTTKSDQPKEKSPESKNKLTISKEKLKLVRLIIRN